jgi:ATP-dependent helicase/nuclease subunit A
MASAAADGGRAVIHADSPYLPSGTSPLTDQQARAVHSRSHSVVLSSGAGCGKTHVLTERYMAHLRDDGAEVGQIVAITFTDRAARQMRLRIREAVTRELRDARTEAEAERWYRHLRALETAPISTIHAFCVNLLRQHAVEAGVDPHFEVLEDVLASNLAAEALTDCLQRLLTTPEAEGDDLRQLVLLYGWRPTVAAVERLTARYDGDQWSDWLQRTAEAVGADWMRFLAQELRPRYVPQLLAFHGPFTDCLKLLRRTQPVPGTKMAGRVGRLLELADRLAATGDPAAALTEMRACARVAGTEAARAWPSEQAYEQVRDALERFRGDLDERVSLFSEKPDDLATAAAVGQQFARVAAQAVQTYRKAKRRAGVVDFQDLLVLSRDLLRDRHEVRERLRRRYQVLLIDELQDTDPVQVGLVEALAGDGLRSGKLFAVGDHKQSIYRFRGADVSLFRALRGRVPEKGRLDLSVNFRSQPAVLDFVNALLGTRMPDYEPLHARLPQANPGPCVEFLWAPRGPKENAADSRRTEANWIARRIAAMVQGEALVADRASDGRRLRPVVAGDIVLLFRAMTNVHLYEAALRGQGLDYHLVGGRAFFAQQEIYDLLNMLRALENPQDAVSLAGTLRSPFVCLSDEALFLLSRHPGGLWAGLRDDATRARLPEDQRGLAGRARENLERWRGLKDRLPVARLLGEVFADSGYDAAVRFEHLGDRKLANLWKLLDLARTFQRSGLFGVAEFIQRLSELVRTQPREEQAATQPENAAAVRLMTIHQSKGLEFPVVFVPDVAAQGGGPHLPVAHWDSRLGCVVRPPADEDPPPFGDFAWRLWRAAEQAEEWDEDLRTLYVACTRAQDYLVLSAALPDPYRPAGAWTGTLAERFDLRSGLCLAGDVPADRTPQVRVTDARTPPPDFSRRALAAEGSPDTEPVSAAGVASVPVRLSADGLRTVGQLDAGSAAPAGFHYHAEDRSDRSSWVRPRWEFDHPDGASESARERILRGVLERWDFRDAAGWREPLRRLAGPAGLPELAQELDRFAASALFTELAVAVALHRDVEYLTTLPGSAARLRGYLDGVWLDGRGSWHLVAYVLEPSSPEACRRREIALAVAARAVAVHLGVAPDDATVFDFGTGEATRIGLDGLSER